MRRDAHLSNIDSTKFLTLGLRWADSGQWTRRAQISSVEAKGRRPVTNEYSKTPIDLKMNKL